MLAALLLIACAALPDSVVSKWGLKKGETLVVARFTGKDTGDHPLPLTKVRVTGKGSLTKALPSDSNLFVFKLKPGVHEIELLEFGRKSIDARSGYLTFNVPDEQDAYTLGTVVVKLLPPLPDERSGERTFKAILGASGGMMGQPLVPKVSYLGDCCPLDVRPERDDKGVVAALASRLGAASLSHIWLKVDRISH